MSRLNKIYFISSLSVIIIAGISLWYLIDQNTSLKSEVTSLSSRLKNVSDNIADIQNQNSGLSNALNSAYQKNADYSNELDKVSTKVESLQRIVSTDPQVLYKYSKVFFLNENYKPVDLTNIDTKYLYNKDKPLQFHDRAWPFLLKLLDDASKEGVDLKVISAYRSYGTQAVLKSSYKVTYGSGTANSFSADQGYSEHQLGTALDFTTPKVGSSFIGFDKGDAYKWLQNNAYKYGFILSYPASNSYYIFEPWHWRFVGLDLALILHNTKQSFYDMDQREINSYLGVVFNGTTTPKTSNTTL